MRTRAPAVLQGKRKSAIDCDERARRILPAITFDRRILQGVFFPSKKKEEKKEQHESRCETRVAICRAMRTTCRGSWDATSHLPLFVGLLLRRGSAVASAREIRMSLIQGRVSADHTCVQCGRKRSRPFLVSYTQHTRFVHVSSFTRAQSTSIDGYQREREREKMRKKNGENESGKERNTRHVKFL